MNDQSTFRRIAAISAILAAVLNLAAWVPGSVAVDFNFEFLENPGDLLTAGLEPDAIRLFRWGEILGVFGFCLLLLPPMLYLWYWLKPRSPRLVTLYTVLGLTSIVFCVIESAVRISIWPPMMAAYPQATEAQREVLQVVFGALTDFAFESMYALNSILFGLWWLGIGLVLRPERRVLGIATAIMGVAILGAGLGWLLQLDPLARLEWFYLFEIAWLIWLGVVIWRRAEKSEPEMEPAMAD
jgi:hypothetical protein